MGFFNNFPYTNFHEMNLDWILKEFENLRSYVEEYTAINNVGYAGVWNITEQYPQWSIVTNGDKSYLSKKPVPAGISIDNTEYWLHLADLDPRIAGIVAQLTSLENNVAILEREYDALSNTTSEISVLNFGAKGDGVTDDTDAFQKTIDACIPHGVVVIPFTGKSYIINGTITIDKPIKIVGLYAGMEPYGAQTTTITAATMSTPLIEHKGGYCFKCSCLGIEFNNISIRTKSNGFQFTGNSLTSGSFGRYLRLSNCTVYITETDGTGFNFVNCFRIVAENCNAFGGHRPFVLDRLTSAVFVSCWARNYSNTGWTILGNVYTSLIGCACDSLEGSSGKHGYYFSDCGGVSMVSCGVENTDDAVVVDTSRGLSISMYCANVGADANSFIVRIGNGSSVNMSGCVSSENRKIEINGSGSLVNISTCDRFTHLSAGGSEHEIPYGFWSSMSI